MTAVVNAALAGVCLFVVGCAVIGGYRAVKAAADLMRGWLS